MVGVNWGNLDYELGYLLLMSFWHNTARNRSFK